MTDTTIQHKRCATCKELKDSSAFHHNRSKPDRLSSQCKACCRKYVLRISTPEERARLYEKRVSVSPTKVCYRCKVELPRKQFFTKGMIPMHYCRTCHAVDVRARYHQDPERARAIAKKSNVKNADKVAARNRSARREWRTKVLQHYGGENPQCACCGEGADEFLSIDHTNGGGNKHRREVGVVGSAFYRWLIENNFPDGFRVLCHNCNFAKGHYGYCPHGNV